MGRRALYSLCVRLFWVALWGLSLTALVPGIRAGQPLTNAPTGVDQIELHPAFQIQRVASEPVVMDPVDLQFDEHGDAFVIEMGGYPFAPEDEALYPGKVVRIEDTDGDGVYDRRIVFADRFRYADSILPYRGGLLVASPPHLFFVKDTDGDQVADVREVLLSGFSVGNSQHNFNGLIYGLDNWIYAGNGGNSGTPFWPDRPEEKFPLRGRDFKLDLARKRLEYVGRTTTGFNVALDAWGRVFTTHNTHHINHLVIPYRYFARNPYLSPPANPDISDHKTGDLDRIYAIGKQEARLNHPEQSGYFSCACGITYYGGGAFPREFEGNIFVADAVLNLIHRDVLRPAGPGFLASRGRPKIEFLASADRHFRPVNMRVGPDGALYVVDMHRVVIEHPEWIPDELEKDMDLYAGSDQGRIYRITPKGGLPRVRPRFDRTRLDAVVAALEHPNKWWRDTAQRLLVWWDDPRAVPLLERLARESASPQGRVHALWTLRGMSAEGPDPHERGRLGEALVVRALNNPHPGVRENALILAEALLPESRACLEGVLRLANDPDARVRMQAALTLGEAYDPAHPAEARLIRGAWLRILAQDMPQGWTRLAVLTGLGRAPMALFEEFVQRFAQTSNARPQPPPSVLAFGAELAELVGTRRVDDELRRLMQSVSPEQPLPRRFVQAVLDGLARGLEKSRPDMLGASAARPVREALERIERSADPHLLGALWRVKRHLGLPLGPRVEQQLAPSAAQVLDKRASLEERLAHLELIGFAPFEKRRELLFELLDWRQPQDLQLAALRQLTAARDKRVARWLIKHWATLSRPVQRAASDYLIYRSDNHDLLLTALEEGRLPMGQLNLDLERRRRLLRSGDPNIRQRAKKLFSDAGVVTRAEVLRRLKPALELAGRPEAGRVLFEKLCSTCHVIAGAGHAVGPDLTEISRKGAATLLQDIFDPNAAVNTEYLNYTVEDDQQEEYTGLIVAETDEVITLRASGGVETTLRRDRIVSLRSSGLSLMPEGLEEGLSLQDVADLLAYLQQPK